jgi:hypothetical protein
MTETPVEPGLDQLLDRIEVLIGRLADPNAPLDRLVMDYEEAGRLVEAARNQLGVVSDRITLKG